jgi:hypothetical protein
VIPHAAEQIPSIRSPFFSREQTFTARDAFFSADAMLMFLRLWIRLNPPIAPPRGNGPHESAAGWWPTREYAFAYFLVVGGARNPHDPEAEIARDRGVIGWHFIHTPRKLRRASESAARHAIPRSPSIPSKYPISSNRKYRPGISDGRPIRSA